MITWLGDALIFACLVAGVLRWSHLSRIWKCLWLQFVIAAAPSVIAWLAPASENHAIYNGYILVEVFCIAFAASQLFPRRGQIAVSVGLLCCLLIWIEVPSPPSFPFKSYAFIANSFFILMLMLGVLLRATRSSKVLSGPDVLFVAAHLVYFGANIPLFSVVNYLASSPETAATANELFAINLWLQSLRYGLLLTGIVLAEKRFGADAREVVLKPQRL